MEKKKNFFGIDQNSLRFVEGLAICFLSIFLALNYGVVSQFFFWCVSFFVGSLFTYLFYIILFVYGLTFMFHKRIILKNLKFSVVGLIILSIGVLIITTCSISYLEDGTYLTFSTFKEIYVISLNLANFPKIEINQSGGIFGYLFVAILNSAFTDLGTKIFSGILIGIGTFFIIFRPFLSLIRSQKEIKLKPSKNAQALNELSDEDLLINTTLERNGNLEYIEEVKEKPIIEEPVVKLNIEDEVEPKIEPVVEEKIVPEQVKEEVVEEVITPVKHNNDVILQSNGLQKLKFSFEGETKFENETVSPTYETKLDSYNEVNKQEETKNEFVEEEVQPETTIEEITYPTKEEIIQTKPTILRGEDANIINREQVNVYNRKLQEDEVKIVQVNKAKKHVKFVPVPIELLADRSSEKDDQKNIEVCDARLEKINEILNDLKIGAKIVSYQIGPSVTRYDLQTERGVSINGFEKYISDISIRLGGLEARFVPLIQGKTTSGIEIANANRSLVNFKDVFTHLPQKKPGQFYIPFGKNISGDYIHADLAEFPHMLVCGTTGSGKSIFMHSVILSLIMRSSIEELRLIMIDPKKVEFTKYRDSPHLLCPVISEPTEASATLLRLADEMEERFDLFQEYDVSNIKQYNEYARENNLEPMYYIVLVVDEFADLIETCKTISQPIQRLGAKARAAGIHMIIATQRPSTDIITGSIKANLAIRVALMTSSVTDSVVALGEGGAEKLLGNGDMLVSCPLISKQEKVRVQGCFVDNNEIIRAVRFIKEKYPLDYNPKFLNLLEKTRLNTEDFGVIHPSNNEDERYEEIKRYIMENKENCSISMIQREFSFGYTRSMKIFNRLIEENIIEKPTSGNSSKGAKVLVHIGSFKSMDEQSSNPGSYSQSKFESN